MSQPPEYPGRQRLKRAATAAGSEAYQGAFEAIGSVLIAGGIGYWVDWRWDIAPIGLLVGVVIGFAAMVLRLVRLGKELEGEVGSDSTDIDSTTSASEAWSEDDLGVGETPGLSSVLRDERERAEADGYAAAGTERDAKTTYEKPGS